MPNEMCAALKQGVLDLPPAPLSPFVTSQLLDLSLPPPTSSRIATLRRVLEQHHTWQMRVSSALDQADSHTKDLLGPAVDAQSNPRATLRIISKLDIELLHLESIGGHNLCVDTANVSQRRHEQLNAK